MAEKKTRRSTGKLVVLNEEELIRQVSLRPILYDRTLKAYRKSGLRLQYWKEVGLAMGATVEECRRRWRSLRDAFSKNYKQNNRMRDDLPPCAVKRKKWVFYDQMSFIAPYLDNACCEIDELLDDFSEDADGMLLMTPDDGTSHETVSPNEECSAKDVLDESAVETADYIKVSSATSTDDSPYTATSHTAYTDLDCDEKFLLSCVPVMRRLPPRKNALARLKIQQTLYDIEFGSDLGNC